MMRAVGAAELGGAGRSHERFEPAGALAAAGVGTGRLAPGSGQVALDPVAQALLGAPATMPLKALLALVARADRRAAVRAIATVATGAAASAECAVPTTGRRVRIGLTPDVGGGVTAVLVDIAALERPSAGGALAARRRAAMVDLARRAVVDHAIVAFYQPQVSLLDGSLVGFEALLRRRTAEGGIAPPASIAAAFEDRGTAGALGRAMLDRVAADIARWQGMGCQVPQVALNVSAAELGDPDFAARLADRLAAARIAHDAIMIEVTEGVFLGAAAERAVAQIHQLSGMGFSISLDDFGTGFASLTHLRQLPVDEIKIDRSFVRELGTRLEDEAIVSSIVNLGSALGLSVIAEGVETQAHARRLQGLGCRLAQGYLYGRPTAPERIPALIAGWDGGRVLASAA